MRPHGPRFWTTALWPWRRRVVTGLRYEPCFKGLRLPRSALVYRQKQRKGSGTAREPSGGILFHWRELDRQVRVRGTVTELPDDESAPTFILVLLAVS